MFSLVFFTWDVIVCLIVFMIYMLWCASHERNIAANIVLIIIAVILYFTKYNVIYTWMIDNPFDTLLLTVCYFTIGLTWSIIKFWIYMNDVSKRVIQEAQLDKTDEQIERDIRYKIDKDKIIFWISYWPISIIWSLFSDVLTNIGSFIVNKWSSLFDKIINDVIDKTKKGVSDKRTIKITR